MAKTTVYGSWHLAEVYAVGLCRLGHKVNLVSSPEICRNYKQGKPPVFEPGIAEGLAKYAQNGQLTFSDNIADNKNQAEICFFAQDVDITPQGVDTAGISKHFRKVAQSRNFKIVCVSSQTPIGTARKWQKESGGAAIVYFPEFLRFGDALERFTEPDYIVLGGEAPAVRKVAALFAKVSSPKFLVSLEEAEMAKHAANIFAAMTVSFVSELTKFSEPFNVNLEKIGEILRHDKRVGPKAYTLPGLGFSGTVGRDLTVLIREAKKLKKRLPLLEAVIAVNNEHNEFMERELRARFKNFRGKKIAFLGATYKPFTSNMRGSLVAPLMAKLEKEGAEPALYDPLAEDNPYKVDSLAEAFAGADAVVVAVGKKDFRAADYKELLRSMKKRIVIDAANMFSKEAAKKLRADYVSIGRGKF